MKLIGETLELFPRRTYLQSVLTHLKQAHDLPEVWYLDLRPAGPKFIVITNPDLAAQVTTATAYPQSPLHDVIVEEADALHTRLQAMADSGDLCKNFVYEFGKFPFEVVSRVFLGAPLGTQTGTGEVYDVMFKLSLAMSVIAGDKNIFKLAVAKWNEWTTSRKLRQAVASHVTPRFEELRERRLYPAVTTLLYAIMLLSAFPETLAKLREEHDRLFDKTYEGTLEMVRRDPTMLKDMKYTTAVIYETLRLFPVAFIIREPQPGVDFIEANGQRYAIDGHTVAVCGHTMHLDPKYFPEPKKFNPDRFLDSSPAYSRNAYRPFERGLRSCMGQTLAMDEMRMALLFTARWFDFELRGHRPNKEPKLPQSDMDTVIGVHAYQTFTSLRARPSRSR
ncbi:unnamed protein product [Parascedosporium putredinis]|nr:unnamed protein product [Parascedosporium putredinis]CAI7990291.1 unnamed protein product [Parascedosporium putredinis]